MAHQYDLRLSRSSPCTMITFQPDDQLRQPIYESECSGVLRRSVVFLDMGLQSPVSRRIGCSPRLPGIWRS